MSAGGLPSRISAHGCGGSCTDASPSACRLHSVSPVTFHVLPSSTAVPGGASPGAGSPLSTRSKLTSAVFLPEHVTSFTCTDVVDAAAALASELARKRARKSSLTFGSLRYCRYG